MKGMNSYLTCIKQIPFKFHLEEANFTLKNFSDWKWAHNFSQNDGIFIPFMSMTKFMVE